MCLEDWQIVKTTTGTHGEHITLSPEVYEWFVAFLNKPTEPSQKLLNAAGKYKLKLKELKDKQEHF